MQIEIAQIHAIFPSILKGKVNDYFQIYVGRDKTFREMYLRFKERFNTDFIRQQYHLNWSSITFYTIREKAKNATKTPEQILKLLFDRLQRCQKAMGANYQFEHQLVNNTIRAIQGVPELKLAFVNTRRRSFEELCS